MVPTVHRDSVRYKRPVRVDIPDSVRVLWRHDTNPEGPEVIPTVTYTTRHRNTATVIAGGRSVTMTTLEVRTCPNCSRRTYAEGLVLSRRPVRRSVACC